MRAFHRKLYNSKFILEVETTSLTKFGRKKNFGIKQVLFTGFFSEIFSDPAQIYRRDEQIRSNSQVYMNNRLQCQKNKFFSVPTYNA